MGFEYIKNIFSNFYDQDFRFRCYLMIGLIAVFTIIVYPNLVVTKHTYDIGDIAEKNIKAPYDFFIEDKDATDANRKKAVEDVLTVYDHDTALAGKMGTQIERAFADIHLVWNQGIINPTRLETNLETNGPSRASPPPDANAISEQVWQLKKQFEENIGINVSKGAYKILIKEKFSNDIASLIIRILTNILENGVVTNKTILLKESEKGVALRDVATKRETPINKLKPYYGLDQAKTMVRIIGQPILKKHNYTMRNLIVDFVQRLIQPNITLNKSETEERKKKIAEAIKPILYQIKAGEMILREGERVTELQLMKLATLQSQTKKEDIVAKSFGAAMVLSVLLFTIYILFLQNHTKLTGNQNKNLLFLAIVLIIFCLIAQISAFMFQSMTSRETSSITSASIIYGIPLASGAMIVCLFMGIEIAIPFAIIVSVCTAVIFQNRFDLFLFFLVNGMFGAYWVRNCRERKVFIKAGAKLGLLNSILVIVLNVYIAELTWSRLPWDLAFAFMGGIVAGIVTAGIAPLVEITFDYTTDIKLLELSNLDQPILRRLMIKAAGTYHHSVIVGTMAESAASEIGANPLLAKVCGYYHDIGKMKQPLYFIENQSGGKNKHDKLAPSMSSLILMAHIKSGVEIAKENKMGQAIIDTIKQHHGTSLISFFYDKAKLQKGEDSIIIDDFRYAGPRPQTKETALVMLADVVEAASRTLANPTPSRVQGLVQNLINKTFSDGQLDNSELTLKDLHSIAKSFNKTLNAIHHHRIEYPDKNLNKNGKVKNGGPDRQQAKPAQDIARQDSEKSKGHLKRLGQS